MTYPNVDRARVAQQFQEERRAALRSAPTAPGRGVWVSTDGAWQARPLAAGSVAPATPLPARPLSSRAATLTAGATGVPVEVLWAAAQACALDPDGLSSFDPEGKYASDLPPVAATGGKAAPSSAQSVNSLAPWLGCFPQIDALQPGWRGVFEEQLATLAAGGLTAATAVPKVAALFEPLLAQDEVPPVELALALELMRATLGRLRLELPEDTRVALCKAVARTAAPRVEALLDKVFSLRGQISAPALGQTLNTILREGQSLRWALTAGVLCDMRSGMVIELIYVLAVLQELLQAPRLRADVELCALLAGGAANRASRLYQETSGDMMLDHVLALQEGDCAMTRAVLQMARRAQAPTAPSLGQADKDKGPVALQDVDCLALARLSPYLEVQPFCNIVGHLFATRSTSPHKETRNAAKAADGCWQLLQGLLHPAVRKAMRPTYYGWALGFATTAVHRHDPAQGARAFKAAVAMIVPKFGAKWTEQRAEIFGAFDAHLSMDGPDATALEMGESLRSVKDEGLRLAYLRGRCVPLEILETPGISVMGRNMLSEEVTGLGFLAVNPHEQVDMLRRARVGHALIVDPAGKQQWEITRLRQQSLLLVETRMADGTLRDWRLQASKTGLPAMVGAFLDGILASGGPMLDSSDELSCHAMVLSELVCRAAHLGIDPLQLRLAARLIEKSQALSAQERALFKPLFAEFDAGYAKADRIMGRGKLEGPR